jgi:undecaprenyl diphosphate synthase
MEVPLHHLAVVIDGVGILPGTPGEAVSLASRIMDLQGSLTADAFELAPELNSLSLFSPALGKLLRSCPEAADHGGIAKALARLETAAAGATASLRFIGSPAGFADAFPVSSSRPSSAPTVNVFVDYSGREEIALAARRLLSAGLKGEIDEERFAAFLLTAGQPDPDLIVFAGGSLSPKDFLLWQSSYSEIWHTPRGGLDFSRQGLLEALTDFRSRHRRFGAV